MRHKNLMPTRVKICGITTWDDARLSIDLGASALGFNFYPHSPRAISLADAWSIIHRLPPFVEAVGVFVNWEPQVVDAVARAARLGSVQLHGAESPGEVAELAGKHRVIKAVQVKPGFRAASLVRVTLVTGLQNQIRVQFSATGHPVIGDRKYHRAEALERRIARVALHAGHLQFIHPRSGDSVSVDCELPQDFQSLLQALSLPTRPRR